MKPPSKCGRPQAAGASAAAARGRPQSPGPEPPGAEGEGRAQEEDAGVRMRSVGGCKRPAGPPRQGRALLLQRLCHVT